MTPERRRGEGGSQEDGFRSRLWSAIDKLSKTLGPAEHEHLVAGLIYLRCLTSAFELKRDALAREMADPRSSLFLAAGADRQAALEQRDRYPGPMVWIPPLARWNQLEAASHLSAVSRQLDIAITTLEQANPELVGMLPVPYARSEMDSRALGELVRVLGEFPTRTPAGTALDDLFEVAHGLKQRRALEAAGEEAERPRRALAEDKERLLRKLDAELEESRRLAREFRRGRS